MLEPGNQEQESEWRILFTGKALASYICLALGIWMAFGIGAKTDVARPLQDKSNKNQIPARVLVQDLDSESITRNCNSGAKLNTVEALS